jgi:hypothetical protein
MFENVLVMSVPGSIVGISCIDGSTKSNPGAFKN